MSNNIASLSEPTIADRASALSLSLVVFAYNEALNVPTVLAEILVWLNTRKGPWQLVFVDDGSTDDTLALAREVCGDDSRCVFVSHATNRGIGAALKSGHRASSERFMTFLPCDGQIPVHELDKLCEAAVSSNVKVVFSVYPNRDDGLHRTILSAAVRTLIYAVHQVRMRSDGPYLVDRALFDPAILVPNTFFLNFEFPIRMLRAKEPSATVEIACVPRRAGVSKSTGIKRIVGVGRELLGLKWRLLRA
ncbi:MAG: glycosyltransferase family 2 protein [Deltaproteobacteria bacterium]|nr:glycosyltransferase family 2 protein [Deltaproteobacteria bacterium]